MPIQASDTNISMKPGENRNWAEEDIGVSKRLGKLIVADGPVSIPFTAGIVRVITSRTTTSIYGENARMVEKRSLPLPLFSSTFTVPNHCDSQESRSGKSKVSLGARKPLRAAGTTIRRPISEPSSDGNSGPNVLPMK